MKKSWLLLLSGLLLIGLLAGCGETAQEAKPQAELTLTPAELSEDTQMLARALGYQGEVQVFDYQLTGAEADRSQSLALEVWRYEEGRWLKQVGTMLEVQQEDKILLVTGDEGFWVIAGYLMNRTSGYYCATEVWGRDLSWQSWWHMTSNEPLTLAPGEEVMLRAQAEVSDDNIPTPTATTLKNFREELAIEGCVVLTATFNMAE